METRSLSLAEYQSRLEAVIKDYGFSFTLSTDVLAREADLNSLPRRVNSGYAGRGKGDGLAGQTNHDAMTVTIRDDLSPLDIARTTTHELAHIVLGHGPSLETDPGFLRLAWLGGQDAVRGVIEAEAESCANAVLGQFGFADETWSENYIDGWMSHVPVFVSVQDSIAEVAAHGAFRIVQLINASAS